MNELLPERFEGEHPPFVAMQQLATLAAAETLAERVDAVTFQPTN